ncbi:MAG: DUF6893 family small protein [Streptosporangiaceae bacterium]
MLGKLIKAVVIAAVLALVIDSLPDFKRYLELRDMLLTQHREGSDWRGSTRGLRVRLLGRDTPGTAGPAGSARQRPGDHGAPGDPAAAQRGPVRVRGGGRPGPGADGRAVRPQCKDHRHRGGRAPGASSRPRACGVSRHA